MKVSVITVCFNSEATIADTIRSVDEQSIADLEHVIVDGGSTDGTLQVVRAHARPARRVVSEPDEGIYEAMNKGLGLASGEIIAFLNSDDVYADTRVLEQVACAFEKDAECEIVYGDLVYVRRNDLSKTVRTWRTKEYDSRYFAEGRVPPHPAFFAKKGILRRSGGFDTNFRFAADYELMLRLLEIEKRKSVHIPLIMVRMRLGGKTNQSPGNVLQGNKDIINAWKKHGRKVPADFQILRILRRIGQFSRFF